MDDDTGMRRRDPRYLDLFAAAVLVVLALAAYGLIRHGDSDNGESDSSVHTAGIDHHVGHW